MMERMQDASMKGSLVLSMGLREDDIPYVENRSINSPLVQEDCYLLTWRVCCLVTMIPSVGKYAAELH